MSRRSLHCEECYHQNVPIITKPINAQSMVCICCLDTSAPLISLSTCTHSEYLDSFSKPELKPGSQVVCIHCHVVLKKIQVFKQQIQNSFQILSDKTSNSVNIYQSYNFNIHKAVDIQIPESYQTQSIIKQDQPRLKKIEAMTSSNKKISNIQTALDIIQSNHNIGFMAASVLNANSLFKLTSTLLNIDFNHLYKDTSGHHDVPSKKFKLELEDNNHDIHSDTQNLQSISAESQQLQRKSMDIQPDSNLILPETRLIKQNPNELQLDPNELVPDPNAIQRYPNELQEDPNELQPVSNLIQTDPNELQLDSNELVADANAIQLYPNELQADPNELQPVSNLIQPDSNELQIDSNKLVPDPNDIQQYPNELQADPNKFPENPNEIQPESNLKQHKSNPIQRESNKNFNRTLCIPKSYKDKLNTVRITVAELNHERALLSQSLEYRKCKYKCHSCIVSFQYQDNLIDHKKRKHNIDSGSFVCKVCSQRAATDKDYKFHILRHYKRFQCVKCEKRFQTCDEAIIHYQKEHVDKKLKSQKQLCKKRKGTLY